MSSLSAMYKDDLYNLKNSIEVLGGAVEPSIRNLAKMSFKRKSYLKKRARNILLTKLREQRRLARNKKQYTENVSSLIYDTSLRLNRSFKPSKPKLRTPYALSMPKKLDLAENIEDTLEFLKALRDNWLRGNHQKLIIDQSKVEYISPATSVLLTAEIHRCMEYQNHKIRVISNYPHAAQPALMLSRMGFYNFLKLENPPNADLKSGLYFRIVSGSKSSADVANNLISGLVKVYNLKTLATKRLQGAIIECMDNVFQHAYNRRLEHPDLVGQWWLAAFFDPETNLTTVIFLDQGVGIPTTLKKNNDRRAVNKNLFSNDENLIETAVLTGLSRKKSSRRGTGLPSLKMFLDEIATDGYLRIVSNRGDFRYLKNSKHAANSLDAGLDGTLILWTLKAA